MKLFRIGQESLPIGLDLHCQLLGLPKVGGQRLRVARPNRARRSKHAPRHSTQGITGCRRHEDEESGQLLSLRRRRSRAHRRFTETAKDGGYHLVGCHESCSLRIAPAPTHTGGVSHERDAVCVGVTFVDSVRRSSATFEM